MGFYGRFYIETALKDEIKKEHLKKLLFELFGENKLVESEKTIYLEVEKYVPYGFQDVIRDRLKKFKQEHEVEEQIYFAWWDLEKPDHEEYI